MPKVKYLGGPHFLSFVANPPIEFTPEAEVPESLLPALLSTKRGHKPLFEVVSEEASAPKPAPKRK